jgi:hypothetical protein
VVAALVGVALWRRAARRSQYVDVVYDDGSVLRLDRGVEGEDLLDDARALLTSLG